jgi:hypothetical protein
MKKRLSITIPFQTASLFLLTILILSLSLTACGGGLSSSGSSQQTTAAHSPLTDAEKAALNRISELRMK